MLGAAALALLSGAAVFAAATLELPAGLVRPSAAVVFDAKGRWIGARASDDGRMWRVPVRREQLPKHLIDAVLTFEDGRFYQHPGIDPLALARAVGLNLLSGKVVSGGSTITMQIARMLERRPRTLQSKLIEAFRAIQLELRYDKDALLSAYLNLAPYGGNIEGVGAAALFYYGKPVEKLTLDEAATLCAIPNAPERLRPDRSGAAGRAKLRARRDDVLQRMHAKGLILASTLKNMRALPVHAKRRSAPRLAPHLSRRLTARRDGAVRSTIELQVQSLVQSQLSAHVRGLRGRGISNAAAVVLDNQSGNVLAWVGSADFERAQDHGQVDGVTAARSPGSALKPFAYALALQEGLIGLNTPLWDIPISYRGWQPQNYDGRYRGVVDLHTALTESLNAPAVRVAEQLRGGRHSLSGLLQSAGVRSFSDRGARCGLTSVLGGCEVSLLELVNLYCTLARGGKRCRARLRMDEKPAERSQLLSREASYLITEVLKDVGRPHLQKVYQRSVSAPLWAWKTGTSYSHRDAWSVGYNQRYTVGVWLGNFDGRSARALVGVKVAAPLLFSIVRGITGSAPSPWFSPPPKLQTRRVCSRSGAPAGPHCPHTKMERAMSAAPDEPCQLHRVIELDRKSGQRLCARCRGARSLEQVSVEVREIWPERLHGWLQARGGAEPIPEHNRDCEHSLPGSPPQILGPRSQDVFKLRASVPRAQQAIGLSASAEPGVSKIHWFVDDRWVGASAPSRTLMWTPKIGKHRIVAVDEEGRSTAVVVQVR